MRNTILSLKKSQIERLKVVNVITPTLTMRINQISYKSTVLKIYQRTEDAKNPKRKKANICSFLAKWQEQKSTICSSKENPGKILTKFNSYMRTAI